MKQAVGYFLVAVALTVLAGLIIGALAGCGPQDDAPHGGATTCAGTGHVKICVPDGTQ
jgi:hypothetical protein